jgi:hypothetical protein
MRNGSTTRRAWVVAVACLAVAATSTACAGGTDQSTTTPTPSPVVSPTSTLDTTTPASNPPGTPGSTSPAARPPVRDRPGAGTALAAVVAIAVKGRAPLTGYDRDRFGSAWSDDNGDAYGHNGCDTRNDVLRRDLFHPVIEAGTNDCVVLSGELRDPYTGQVIPFVRGTTTSTLVQIDHVVALGDAWQTGAGQWTDAKRQDFANDPLNLLAVDGSANESKGDGDAATWLPPSKSFRCRYVARQTAVKAKYGLWMTAAEQSASRQILAGCAPLSVPSAPGRIHPLSRSSVAIAPPSASPPSTSPPTKPPATKPPGGDCEPGYSPCLPITDDLDCGDIDDSLKPIHVTGDDPYRLDGDGDGFGCDV